MWVDEVVYCPEVEPHRDIGGFHDDEQYRTLKWNSEKEVRLDEVLFLVENKLFISPLK